MSKVITAFFWERSGPMNTAMALKGMPAGKGQHRKSFHEVGLKDLGAQIHVYLTRLGGRLFVCGRLSKKCALQAVASLGSGGVAGRSKQVQCCEVGGVEGIHFEGSRGRS